MRTLLHLVRTLPLMLVTLAACDGPPEPVWVDPEAHAAAVQRFHEAREAELSAPDSWLSLIGLHWLPQGETTLGSHVAADIVLPRDKAPGWVGTLHVDGVQVRFQVEPGVVVTQGVDSTLNLRAGSGAFPPDVSGDPAIEDALLTEDLGYGKFVVLRHGSLNWIVIRRGERVALRLRDNEDVSYGQFHGIERFPASVDWRVTARWVPQEKTVAVPNVLGTVAQERSPARLEFWIRGERYALDVTGAPDDAEYMMVFADSTSGRDTYGGGRYLWVEAPDDQGRVVLDFNLAYNPPCVWTPFATCPLPSADNRLPLAVLAGEKSWAH